MNDRSPSTGATSADATAGRRRTAKPRYRAIVSIIVGVLQVALIGAVLAGGAYAAYWFNANEGTAREAADAREEASRLVEIVIAERADHPVRVRAMGTVRAAREAVIRPRVSGMIVAEAESFVPGGFFERDAFMVQLDRADYEQTLLQRETELAQAEAALQIELGDQAVAREELELLEVDIPDINRDLILRIPQVNQAKASVRAAEATVLRAQLDLDRTRLTAPFDGHLVSRAVSTGNNVSAGDELAVLVGAEKYWVEVAVPVSSLRWIDAPREPGEPGSPARVRNPGAWGPGVIRAGTVTQLVGRLEEGSRLARLLVTVPDPLALDPTRDDKPALMLGSFVDVEIEGRILSDVLILDRNLVREGDVVWAMGDDDRLHTKPVTIAYRGRDMVYVTGGLAAGERVIRTNLTTPVNGMLLRTTSDADDPAGEGRMTAARAEDAADG